MTEKFNINEAIENRRSIRNFHDLPLHRPIVGQISNWLDDPANLTGPFGSEFEFELLIESGEGKERLGTYGFIKNAQGYIVGSSPKDTYSLVEFGYVFERMVLFLTSINVGTCWLAGTFDRQQLNSRLSLDGDRIIPAITPIGAPTKNKHFKEKITRRVIKADGRKPANELFFYQDFGQPLDGMAEEFHMPLHYVRIGPSAKNMQPWRLVFNEDLSQVHFYLISDYRSEKKFACDVRYLDIGIALCHFTAGTEAAGIPGKLITADPQLPGAGSHEYITTWVRADQNSK